MPPLMVTLKHRFFCISHKTVLPPYNGVFPPIMCFLETHAFTFSFRENSLPTGAPIAALNDALVSLCRATFSVRTTRLSLRLRMLRLTELLVCIGTPRTYVVSSI